MTFRKHIEKNILFKWVLIKVKSQNYQVFHSSLEKNREELTKFIFI